MLCESCPTAIIRSHLQPLEKNFTKWDHHEVQRDPKNKAFGGHSALFAPLCLSGYVSLLLAIVINLVHKLLFDILGTKYFLENSIYSWFPMTLPQTMEASFADNLVPTKDWTFKRPCEVN
jgi:hypothetical protein